MTKPTSWFYAFRVKGPKTKAHIAGVAADIFRQNSYHGVKMNQIAAVAGVNKATIYQYFPSKEALALAAINEYEKSDRENVFNAAIQSTEDPIDQLRAIYQRIFERHQVLTSESGACCGCPLVSLSSEMATELPSIRDAIAGVLQGYGDFYLQIVEDAKTSGDAAPDLDAQTAVTSLVATMNGAQVAAKVENRPEAILEGCDRAIRLLTAT